MEQIGAKVLFIEHQQKKNRKHKYTTHSMS